MAQYEAAITIHQIVYRGTHDDKTLLVGAGSAGAQADVVSAFRDALERILRLEPDLIPVAQEVANG